MTYAWFFFSVHYSIAKKEKENKTKKLIFRVNRIFPSLTQGYTFCTLSLDLLPRKVQKGHHSLKTHPISTTSRCKMHIKSHTIPATKKDAYYN